MLSNEDGFPHKYDEQNKDGGGGGLILPSQWSVDRVPVWVAW